MDSYSNNLFYTMIKKIFYWCLVAFILLLAFSFFAQDGFKSLITGISTGFSVAIGNIVANDYIYARSKKIIKRIESKGKKRKD